MVKFIVIGIVLSLIVLLLFGGISNLRFSKWFGIVIVRAVIVSMFIIVINILGASFHYHIPLNGISVGVGALLGMPGFVVVALMSYLS
ncbi:MAG: pro-sigmaK processing inhibitor BofA family protein [Bacilli bacterium]